MYPDSRFCSSKLAVRRLGVAGGLERIDKWSGELGRSVVTLSITEPYLEMGMVKCGGFVSG